jgi:hypothetical protein
MLRLRQICLVSQELSPAVEVLSDVFGLASCFHDPAVGAYGLENALLPVGTNFLEVVAPVQESTAAGRYLQRRGGAGGYMVILQCDDVEARRARMGVLGVRIANPLNYGDFTGIQLHPRDTGGAMLETDQNRTAPGIQPATIGEVPYVRTALRRWSGQSCKVLIQQHWRPAGAKFWIVLLLLAQRAPRRSFWITPPFALSRSRMAEVKAWEEWIWKPPIVPPS